MITPKLSYFRHESINIMLLEDSVKSIKLLDGCTKTILLKKMYLNSRWLQQNHCTLLPEACNTTIFLI